MREFISARARSLAPSGIRKYFDIVQTMQGAISLGVGEPDFTTPWDVRNAAIRSIQRLVRLFGQMFGRIPLEAADGGKMTEQGGEGK